MTKKLLKQMVDDEKYRKPKTLHTSKFSYENVIIGDDASQLILTLVNLHSGITSLTRLS